MKRSGQKATAKVEEQRAAEAEPQTALDHFLLGERARGADSIAHYTAALRVEADHVPSFLRMGDLYRRGKHPEQAQLCYTAALGLLPDDAISITRKTYGYRGILYQDMGDLALALAAFTAARDVDPQRWSTYALRGLLYHEMKNYQKAVDDFSEALKLIEDHKAAVARLRRGHGTAAEVYMNRGHSYRELGQFEAAAADFDRAAQLVPLRFGDEVALLYVMGREEFRNPAKALALYRTLVAARRKQLDSPSLRNALAKNLHSLGHLLETSGRLDEAEQAFAEFLSIYKKLAAELPDEANYQENTARGYIRLITVLRKNRRWAKAGTVLGEARKLKYQHPNFSADLAWWLATWPDEKLRDPRRAIELAKEAIKVQSNNPGHWSNLGTAHYRAGNWPEAVAALEKYNDHVHDAFFLAMAHWQLDNKEKARNYFDEAVKRMRKRDPDDEELARFRAEAAALLEIKKPSGSKTKTNE